MSEIQEIALKQGKNGDFFSITADGRKYNAFSGDAEGPNKAFDKLQNKSFKIGDKVKLDYVENPGTSRTGQPIVFKNLTDITMLTASEAAAAPAAPATEYEKKEEYWRKKSETDKITNIHIARQACLRRAIEYLALNRAEIKGEISIEAVKRVTDAFEKHVTRTTGDEVTK